MNQFLSRLLWLVVLLGSSVQASALADLTAGPGSAFGEVQSEPEFLKVDQAFIFSEEIVSGGLKLSWNITKDYYLYRERFKFKVLGPDAAIPNATLGTPDFSTQGKAKEDPYFGQVHVIHDQVSVFLPVTLNDGVSDAEIKVTYQGCAEAGLCYPPTHKKILYVPVAGDSASATTTAIAGQINIASDIRQTPDISPAQGSLDDAAGVFDFIQNSSLLTIIGIFFLLGLGLTFTPCVFPMIPIITSIIAGQEKPTVARSFALSSVYVLGMAITYATAGVVTGLLGASANIQAALQDPYLLSAFAIIFVLLALAMFGLYELQLPAFVRDRLNTKSQKLSGGQYGSVFMIGALSALIVSPCVSAPLAGALLYISATADAVIGGASLFALGLGMGVPLILISVGGGKYFPKAGKWMDAVKAVFGVMLIAVAIWLIGRFADPTLIMVLWAALFGLSATQMGAFDSASPGWPRIFKGLGLILALYAALLLIGASSGGQNPLKPLEGLANTSGPSTSRSQTINADFEIIYSMSGLQQVLNTTVGESRPTMVDFYADWCISCKIMESEVFPLPDIYERMQQFKLVKADVTENSEANQALMTHFNLFGPPSILFFDAQGNELQSLRIVGEITAKDFRKRLDKALSSKAI